MKRFLTLCLLLCSFSPLLAQQKSLERNPWWWGVDLGASFQTSDMQPKAGLAFGIQGTKFTRMSSSFPIFLGLRFRFIDGRNYGYNYHPLDIQANPVLNSGSTNYTSPFGQGYVFNNYKFRYDELAAELLIGSNSLRKKGILLYAFGGAGLNYWITQTNQLDASGSRYNYREITAIGDADAVDSQLESLLDDTYETRSDGSVDGARFSFMPSAGIGLGYAWNSFSIGLEHRTTFALNDVIDGTRFNSSGLATSNKNDMYHYAGIFFRLRFGSNQNTSTTDNTPLPASPKVPNALPNNPSPQNPPQNDPVVVSQPNTSGSNPNMSALPPPVVQFTNPSTNPFVTSIANQQLTVRITNVLQSNQISLTINGKVMPQSTFNFNAASKAMTFNHTLQPGNNTYSVIATNAAGSGNASQTITFKGSTTTSLPTVQFTNPSGSTFTSSQQVMTVTATTQYVPALANIVVTRNGQTVSNVSFNPANGQVSFTANLLSGNNLYQIAVSNASGTATDAVTISYSTVPVTVSKPIVTITNPASCPFQTKSQTVIITATVTNVTVANQIHFLFNNAQRTDFSFALNGATATINLPVTLNNGNNTISITGTNSAGTDTKSCQLIYSVSAPTVPAPLVNITNPSANPFTATVPTLNLTASVTNITNQNQIRVLVNNVVTTNFSFNTTTGLLNLPLKLSRNTIVIISATNNTGTGNDQVSINYSISNSKDPVSNSNQNTTISNDVVGAVAGAPVLNLVIPSSNKATSTTQTYAITMKTSGISKASEINVKVNGNSLATFNFNSRTRILTFTATLTPGTNTIKVRIENSSGVAEKDITIVYTPQSKMSSGKTSGQSEEIPVVNPTDSSTQKSNATKVEETAPRTSPTPRRN